MKQLTLCLIYEDGKILLGLKKRGFGQGRWNGFGGKLQENETIEQAAIRELKEESGIHAHELEKKGIIQFQFQEDIDDLEVHIFHVINFNGEPIESEEMKPQWFEKEKIPYEEMWSDDKHWMPLFLEGKKFKGNFLFGGEKSNDIIKSELIEVEEL